MLEMLISPKRAERRPWEMLFVGAFYASISVLLVSWIFSQDDVLKHYSGVLVVTFTVMFTIPFMYYMLRFEEERATHHIGSMRLLKEHRHAIWAVLWLLVGFVLAYSFWYALLPNTQSFDAQLQTYCLINRPAGAGVSECAKSFGDAKLSSITNFAVSSGRLFHIFANNIYVLILIIAFSLVFGAGVIFILAWNASVISTAITIFTQSDLKSIPIGFFRYMLHGIPEIGAYFISALAGGIISVAVVKHEFGSEKFWEIVQDSLDLIILSVVVLFAAALLEVFVTPIFF